MSNYVMFVIVLKKKLVFRFADRAKQIENKPVKNLDPKDLKIQQLMEEIEK